MTESTDQPPNPGPGGSGSLIPLVLLAAFVVGTLVAWGQGRLTGFTIEIGFAVLLGLAAAFLALLITVVVRGRHAGPGGGFSRGAIAALVTLAVIIIISGVCTTVAVSILSDH